MFTTYAGLVSKVQSYMKSPRFDSEIDTFIGMAEGDFNTDIRAAQMEIRTSYTTTDSEIDYPADALQIRQVLSFYAGDEWPLKLVPPDAFSKLIGSTDATNMLGNAQYYCVENNKIRVTPAGDGTDIDVVYYQKIPALTGANNVNWLITDYPLVYWYGTISKFWEWRMNTESMGRYFDLYAREVRKIKAADDERKYGTTPQIVIA